MTKFVMVIPFDIDNPALSELENSWTSPQLVKWSGLSIVRGVTWRYTLWPVKCS